MPCSSWGSLSAGAHNCSPAILTMQATDRPGYAASRRFQNTASVKQYGKRLLRLSQLPGALGVQRDVSVVLGAQVKMTRLREPPWFEELSPQLLRNKAIRTFLQAYSDHEWPEVTKLVLLYGIVSLTRQYPGQVLSLAALREALSAGASAQAVETAIPDLQDKLSELRLQLDDVQDDLQPRGEVSPFWSNDENLTTTQLPTT